MKKTLIIALIILVFLILYLWLINKTYSAPPETYCGFPDKKTHDKVVYWIKFHGIRPQDDVWKEGGVYYFLNKEGEKCRLIK